MASLDESKIIDREAEAEIFNGMLLCKTPRRILVVSDKSGMGKSIVLRKLRYLCEWTHVIPAALVNLLDFQDRPDVFALTLRLHETLVKGGASFPRFDAQNDRRQAFDIGSPLAQPQFVQGTVDATEAHITGSARVAGGGMIIVERGDFVYQGSPARRDEADANARALCADLFLDDLLDCAREKPVVLLFDTVDQAGDELRRWLFLDLIRKRLLPGRNDHRLIVVLAGQGVAEMLTDRLQPEFRDSIEPIASLSRWDLHHVEQFLAVHGIDSLRKDEIQIIHSLLGQGRTLTEALLFAELLAKRVS